MAKERYAGPPHLTEAQLIAQRKKARGDGTIMKIGSVANGFVEDVRLFDINDNLISKYLTLSQLQEELKGDKK